MQENDLQSVLQELFRRGYSVEIKNEAVIGRMTIRVWDQESVFGANVNTKYFNEGDGAVILAIYYQLCDILVRIQQYSGYLLSK